MKRFLVALAASLAVTAPVVVAAPAHAAVVSNRDTGWCPYAC